MDTDTLILTKPSDAKQIRVTLGGTNGAVPDLRFIGLSFSNTKVPTTTRPPNRAAWGKIISTPEHSQHGYPNEKGWCSPTSLSMVLSRWAKISNRPEMNLTVPEVAAAVYDDAYGGTGNWPFNTAYASELGMRAFVTRLRSLDEIEQMIGSGIPMVVSVSFAEDAMAGAGYSTEGHLMVVVGFTDTGDVIVNDPASHLIASDCEVQTVYDRGQFTAAWMAGSHGVVYVIHPPEMLLPPSPAEANW